MKPITLGCLFVAALFCFGPPSTSAQEPEHSVPAAVQRFIAQHCLDCHDSGTAEAGLDLESLGFDLARREVFDRWVMIHDRVRDGQMPPPDDGVPRPVVPVGWSWRANWDPAAAARMPGIATDQPSDVEPTPRFSNSQPAADDATASPARRDAPEMLKHLIAPLVMAEQRRVAEAGRAKVRRLNRSEYENTLRQVLDAPWLQVAQMLPEDGVHHLYPKAGERLDVSHVQLMRYLEAAQHAIRMATQAAAHPTQTRKFYAREEPTMQNYLHYRFGQMASTRSIVPLIGTTPEPEIIRKRQPLTVGAADPEKREQEAMGVFSGVYSATTKYDFTRIDAPIDGHYRLRFKTYTFMAGPNGADGGDDHGLTGGRRAWWRPDRNVAFPGQRSEPVTLYALAESGDSRWLTTFDSYPEPSVFECVVALRQGEGIRPDAARLVRTRPGWSGNPNATPEGVPGFAMNWLEVTGPLHPDWPPPSYKAIFGNLPFEVAEDGQLRVQSQHPRRDGRRLLTAFYRRAMIGQPVEPESVRPIVDLFEAAIDLGEDFTGAMTTAAAAVLCSPQFLYLEADGGPLPEHALRERLAYFLWNGPPDPRSPALSAALESPTAMADAVDAMLDDPRSDRFIESLLDYWLDLREINANTPDAELYPDYYLDELLTESSVLETRRFVRELIDNDLPVRHLVDADFAFVNERLAQHYGLPAEEGVRLRRVDLPAESPRGGLLTQASVLRVTANGTTTSPVLRGVWIVERILGIDIPSPPSGIAAVEPDIRGATTIREQLEKHRAIESCNACHARFDPAGFALESFDVAGGWRDRYRAIGDAGEPVEGIGKNGHAFRFTLGQPVDCSGTLLSGQTFTDIRELKRLLAADQRLLARNLLHQLIVYATGTPVMLSDRGEVEAMLDRATENDYGVRTLIHAVAQSDMFRRK